MGLWSRRIKKPVKKSSPDEDDDAPLGGGKKGNTIGQLIFRFLLGDSEFWCGHFFGVDETGGGKCSDLAFFASGSIRSKSSKK